MKKSLVDATNNSLYSLDQDFELSTKKVVKEQEAALLEDQLLKAAMDASLKNVYNTQPPQGVRAAGLPNSHNQPQKNSKSDQAVKLAIQLGAMGFTTQESLKGIGECPPNATIDQVINKIQANRNNQPYTFSRF